MNRHFIVVQSFCHQTDCFCPGSIHSELLRIEQGDIIKVTNERKFTAHNGWYYMVVLEDENYFYIALSDLEQYYARGQIFLREDIEWNMNYLNCQVDLSLDRKDEVRFKYVSKQLIEANKLKKKLEKYEENDQLFHV